MLNVLKLSCVVSGLTDRSRCHVGKKQRHSNVIINFMTYLLYCQREKHIWLEFISQGLHKA